MVRLTNFLSRNYSAYWFSESNMSSVDQHLVWLTVLLFLVNQIVSRKNSCLFELEPNLGSVDRTLIELVTNGHRKVLFWWFLAPIVSKSFPPSLSPSKGYNLHRNVAHALPQSISIQLTIHYTHFYHDLSPITINLALTWNPDPWS